ncbi:MAG: hypothetical protein FWD69_04705 [Polyangiaceae bacterium]|nr:hypothetical protein [Polyangiaceae bacterium]
MKTGILFAPVLVIALIFACSSKESPEDGTGGDSEDGHASVTFALSGGDFTGNSVRICGSRPPPDPKYRCSSSLTSNVDGACPCFNFAADGSLIDPATGQPVVITGLCSSTAAPPANWSFQYEVFSEQDCTGTRINDGTHNFTCYDSHDISTRAFPNQSVNDVLSPGANTNYVLCTTTNASKSWNFANCIATTTVTDIAAGISRYDCGCTPAAGGTCDCGDGGVGPGDLEAICSFDTATCNIVCEGS